MHRDRPLQNSMFLQDTNGNRRGSIQHPTNNFNMIHKSSQMTYGLNINDNQYNMQGIINTGNTSSRKFYLQQQKQMMPNRNLQQRINQMNEKLENMGKLVDKHEFQLGSAGIQNKKDQISRQIISEIKQSLPTITGNNDIYEHIFNFKLELKTLREEINKIASKTNIEGIDKNSLNADSPQKKSLKDQSFPNKEHIFNEIKNQILRPRDQFFKNLINNIETQIGFLKKNLQNYTMDLKVSPISSSSCIILKYQELFKSRSKGDSDMIISEQTYYIDNEGYLLDCHSRYIVDQKGKKVKLEDRHISMLKNQRILQ